MRYLFLLVGVFAFIGRAIGSIFGLASQQGVIGKIKRKPAFAASYAESLDISYNTEKGVDLSKFRLIISKITSSPVIAKYKILHTHAIDDANVLVFTELSFEDLGAGFSGNVKDVKKITYHNFLLKLDEGRAELTVFSDLYETATEKFQKQEFFLTLMKTKVKEYSIRILGVRNGNLEF